MHNAESLAVMCVLLYLLVRWPEWDFGSGRAVRRGKGRVGWLECWDFGK